MTVGCVCVSVRSGSGVRVYSNSSDSADDSSDSADAAVVARDGVSSTEVSTSVVAVSSSVPNDIDGGITTWGSYVCGRGNSIVRVRFMCADGVHVSVCVYLFKNW